MSLKHENVQISPMSQGPRSSTTVAVLFLPSKTSDHRPWYGFNASLG